MKIFTLLLLLATLSFASDYKKLGIIPADINYNVESAEEFSEILYDSIANAIAEYNFSQKNSLNMYHISETIIVTKNNRKYKETLLASKKFQKEIKCTYKKIKKDYMTYMKKRHLEKLLVMDFSTKKVTHTMSKCKKLCNVKINFIQYTLGQKPKKMTKTYKYNAKTCLLSDASTDAIDKNIELFLGK